MYNTIKVGPSCSGSIAHSLIFAFFGLCFQGRSRSLTHMDALETETVFRDPVGPEPLLLAESPKLIISPPLHIRRQKLARSQVIYRSLFIFNQCTKMWKSNHFDKKLKQKVQ